MCFLLCGVATLGLVMGTAVCTAQTGDLRAGAAKVDISPTKDMFPLKAMQVYGSVHDPVFVRALVVDNGLAKTASSAWMPPTSLRWRLTPPASARQASRPAKAVAPKPQGGGGGPTPSKNCERSIAGTSQ